MEKDICMCTASDAKTRTEDNSAEFITIKLKINAAFIERELLMSSNYSRTGNCRFESLARGKYLRKC